MGIGQSTWYEDAVIDNLISRDVYTAQKARLVEQRDNAQKAEAEIYGTIPALC